MTGVFLVNYGGVIEFLRGIKAMKYMLAWNHLKKKDTFKTKMYLIHGSHLPYGHSQL